MRHGLDRASQVVAAPLPGDHLRVDLARSEVGETGRFDVDETLVVAEVEIGLRAVDGNEHLAVLVRRHRAGVDVQVRVELGHGHGDAAALQHAPDRGDDDAFAE